MIWTTHKVIFKAIIQIQVVATLKNSIYFLKKILCIPIVFHLGPRAKNVLNFSAAAIVLCKTHFLLLAAGQIREDQC